MCQTVSQNSVALAVAVALLGLSEPAKAGSYCDYLRQVFFATRSNSTEAGGPRSPSAPDRSIQTEIVWPAPGSIKAVPPPPKHQISITDAESKVIADYCATIGVNANLTIRTNLPTGGMSVAAAKQHVEAFDKALRGFPDFVGTVYRKFYVAKPAEILEKYKPGKVVTEPTPTSTSKTPDAEILSEYDNSSPNIFMIIESRSGKDISEFSGIPREQEIAFATGAKFLVTGVYNTGSTVFLRLAEIK